jgi:hypothetical protein
MFHQRWLPRRSQFNLAHIMILVAVCGAGFGLSRLPATVAALLAVALGIVFGPLVLARKGFKLLDIVTVMAIVLLALGFLLPAMVQTRYRTSGRRTIPVPVPPRFTALFQQD